MASTDAKSGFRLPWSTDRNDSDDPSATSADPTTDPAQSQSAEEAPAVSDAREGAPQGEAATSADPVTSAGAPSPAPAATRKPNKFMADLTKAMQTAAESARADVLEKFSAEAKSHIEAIHASTANEATELRKRADEDIAGIREWSKNEIARIREETDERITHRKDVLEREIEAHAAQIEARIERVQSRVTSFEGEMAAFFERLLSEEDPTRFAAMAETLPEPPSFDNDDVPSSDWSTPVATAEAPVEAPAEAIAPVEVDVPVEAEAPQAVDDWGAPEAETAYTGEAAPDATSEYTEPPAEATAEASERSGWESETPVAAPDDAWAADAPVAETAVAEAAPQSTSADTGDLFGITADDATADVDPRLSALGTEQDFAAAEAEAGSFTAEVTTDDQEIPTIAEDALAARLAGLVATEEPDAPSEAASTRVVVTGLVSVASIAGFKRNLSRVSGVRSVGVSSGPDGEFVFAVNHDPGLDLTDGIATLPGFSARVTNEALGELTVAARDPESEG